MTTRDPAKVQAARRAATLVETGMIVGLGSGTTATEVVLALADRLKAEGLKIVGVSTSEATAQLARSLNIPLKELDDVNRVDLVLDGADEVDPRYRLIKGLGGALLREKIVAAAADRHATVITPEKRVERLGTRSPVPVEVSPFGYRHISRALHALGAEPTLRTRADGSPWLTDGHHLIVDCRFPGIDDPTGLDQRLKSIPGVFETGLFLNLCEVLVIGRPDGAEIVERPSSG